jgi:hypothetical protein
MGGVGDGIVERAIGLQWDWFCAESFWLRRNQDAGAAWKMPDRIGTDKILLT